MMRRSRIKPNLATRSVKTEVKKQTVPLIDSQTVFSQESEQHPPLLNSNRAETSLEQPNSSCPANSGETSADVNIEAVSIEGSVNNGSDKNTHDISSQANECIEESSKNSTDSESTTSQLKAVTENVNNNQVTSSTNSSTDGKKRASRRLPARAKPKVTPRTRSSQIAANEEPSSTAQLIEEPNESARAENGTAADCPESDSNQCPSATVVEECRQTKQVTEDLNIPSSTALSCDKTPQRKKKKYVHSVDSPTRIKVTEELKKINESRQIMAEKQRYYSNLVEPPDRKKMTLMDFIFWNPSGNEMSKPNETSVTDVENSQSVRLEEENVDDPGIQNNETEANAEEEEPAPKLRIGENGEIILDEDSLYVKRPVSAAPLSSTVVHENELGTATYASFSKKKSSYKRWSKKETIRFYKALSIIGTDFMLMSEIFPNRSREDLKKKFRLEERKHHSLVTDTIYNSSEFAICDMTDDDLSDDPDANESKEKPRKRKYGVPDKEPKSKRPRRTKAATTDDVKADGDCSNNANVRRTRSRRKSKNQAAGSDADNQNDAQLEESGNKQNDAQHEETNAERLTTRKRKRGRPKTSDIKNQTTALDAHNQNDARLEENSDKQNNAQREETNTECKPAKKRKRGRPKKSESARKKPAASKRACRKKDDTDSDNSIPDYQALVENMLMRETDLSEDEISPQADKEGNSNASTVEYALENEAVSPDADSGAFPVDVQENHASDVERSPQRNGEKNSLNIDTIEQESVRENPVVVEMPPKGSGNENSLLNIDTIKQENIQEIPVDVETPPQGSGEENSQNADTVERESIQENPVNVETPPQGSAKENSLNIDATEQVSIQENDNFTSSDIIN